MSRPRRVDAVIAVALYAVVAAEIVGSDFETDAALLVAAGLILTLPLAIVLPRPFPVS